MPASGYELGMGQFLLPGLGVFLIGWLVVVVIGWAIQSHEADAQRARQAKQHFAPRHDEIQRPIFRGQISSRWDHVSKRQEPPKT